MSYYKTFKTVEQLNQELQGKILAKVIFADENADPLQVESILFTDGVLLTLSSSTLSHPEAEQEEIDFLSALNEAPSKLVIIFKAKFLSDHFLQESIKERRIAIGANATSPGPADYRPGFKTVRFHME